MKKGLLLVTLCSLSILLVGCTNKEEQEEVFKTAAKSYYEEHMTGLVDLDYAEVTLGDLRNASEKYELSVLKKCDDSSSVTFTITEDEVTSEEVKLTCK